MAHVQEASSSSSTRTAPRPLRPGQRGSPRRDAAAARAHGKAASIAAQKIAMLDVSSLAGTHDPSLPSPSKELDHPIYDDGSRMARLIAHEVAHPTSAASTSYLPSISTVTSSPMDDTIDSGVSFNSKTAYSDDSMDSTIMLDASTEDTTPPTPSMTVFPPFESDEKPQYFHFAPADGGVDIDDERPRTWHFPTDDEPSIASRTRSRPTASSTFSLNRLLHVFSTSHSQNKYVSSPSLNRPHPRIRHAHRGLLSMIRLRLSSPKVIVLLLLSALIAIARVIHGSRAASSPIESRTGLSAIRLTAGDLAAAVVDSNGVAKVKKGLQQIRKSIPRNKAGRGAAAKGVKRPGGAKKAVGIKAPAVAAVAAPAKMEVVPVDKPPLLGLDQIPRRFMYGANFIANEKDEDKGSKRDRTNVLLKKALSEKDLKKRADYGKKRYFEEKELWQSFVWVAPAPDASLDRFIDRLDDEEKALREWTYEMRINPEPAAQPVGLAANASFLLTEALEDAGHDLDDLIEEAEAGLAAQAVAGKGPRRLPAQNKKREAVAVPPSKDEPKKKLDKRGAAMPLSLGDFSGGSLSKWGALMTEQKARYGGMCAGATWLDEYKEMHEQMLLGEKPASLISYHCEHDMNCGGLGDRLLGMTSAFFFGLVTNRAFLAEWQVPTPIDVIFDSPAVDWSYSSFDSESHPVLNDEKLLSEAADLDIIHFDRRSMDRAFGSASWTPHPKKRLTRGLERRDLAFKSRWIKFFSNRGMIYRASSKYQHLQPRLQELGLKPQTTFGCILNYLFRPKPPALDFISKYTSVLTLPSVFSVGIQIRTGDASMKSAEYDATNTVGLHKDFFRCADQLAEIYALPDQKVVYFLVTDSNHLRQDAQKQFGDKVIISGAGIEHIHQKTAGHADGVYNAVLEDWILAKTDYRVITQDSGFGKIATFASGRKSSTVSIFPATNADVKGLKGRNSHTHVDCRLESAFVTMDELSNEWSLG